MSLTLSTDTARSSLQATSEQISVVSRNIARIHDPDATRKTATIVTGPGVGVSIPQIDRTSNQLLFNAYLTANSANQAQASITSALDQIQSTVDDTDQERSPAALMAKLSAALQTYSGDPQNPAVAASVVSAAKDVSNALNSASNTVTQVRQQADTDIATSVANINDLLSQFQNLNNQVIRGTSNGSDITDVLDARDAVLKQLSTEVGIRTVTRDNGDVAIYTDSGVTLFDKVPRSVTFQQTSNLAAGMPGAAVYADGVPIAGTSHIMEIQSGKLAGLVSVRDDIAVTYQSQLDEMARGLIDAFAETDQSATPTLPAAAGLFTYSSGPTLPPSGTAVAGLASSIKINPNVDPGQGGNAELIRDGGISGAAYKYNTANAPAYTERLQALIANLGSGQTFDPSTQLPSSSSVIDYAKNSVSWLEALRQSASAEADYRSTVAHRATSSLSQATGVNLDEEMTNLLDLERTFQASSRLINTVNEMLSTLIQSFS
ncbi:flagellar hook-associated protein FlgK [Hyphomicrobium denitrificans 1NES1]|uniref:Flagellar hook-associated protein 1 n=1 Tax=Hyphomicrobium denitrificans 1NES1 TaxID=670307 RepID=N0BFY9_9HYPH|nr:flagellar hook-associated protein FlgK [Hyphomicrobium denitrificans]AGK59386.1 flagellar hook-associated protein FlgK [Hyphomicrobium denitrificans 1NES1]